MKVSLDISQNILEQFCAIFGISHVSGLGSIEMSPDVGVGKMDLIVLPDGLEFYHYSSTLQQPMEIISTNPDASEWFGLIVNLGNAEVLKRVGTNEVAIQRSLPSGILVYPPGSLIKGMTPADQYSESVFIRFHVKFLDTYFDATFDALRPANGTVLFEDLDYRSEMLLNEVIRSKGDRLAVHANVLAFMRLFLNKIETRDVGETSASERGSAERMNVEDLKSLFRASAMLRDPVATETPSIPELAELAHMGATKFKTSFRAVFGLAPLQYHHRVRMDYARDELLAQRKSPTELSYELGYSHPSKFTAAFKKHFGQLPSRVAGEQFRL